MSATITANPLTPAIKKVKKAAGPKKAKAPKAHPGVASMINAAIVALKERNGSSLQAIKKYIQANYKVDIDRLSPFIKKHLKNATTKGLLVQTKGNGASGSFKLSKNKENKPAKKPAKKVVKKAAGEKKPKPEGVKKVKKAKSPEKKDKKVVKKAKSPEKKVKKVKAAKPKKAKTDKPKKASPAKAAKKAKTPIKKTAKPKVVKVKKTDKK